MFGRSFACVRRWRWHVCRRCGGEVLVEPRRGGSFRAECSGCRSVAVKEAGGRWVEVPSWGVEETKGGPV